MRTDRDMTLRSSGPDEVIGEALPNPIIVGVIGMVILSFLMSFGFYYYTTTPWLWVVPLFFPVVVVAFWWEEDGKYLLKDWQEEK